MVEKSPAALVEPNPEATLGLNNGDPGHGLDHINAGTETRTMPRVLDQCLDHDRIPRSGRCEVAQLRVSERFKQTKRNDHGGIGLLGIHDV